MALPLTNVVGRFPLPDDSVLASTVITFTLSGVETDGVDTLLPLTIRTQTDGSGNVDVDLWANEDGDRETYYKVHAEVVASDPFGQGVPVVRSVFLGAIVVPTSGPVNVSDLLLNPVPNPDQIAALIVEIRDAEAAAIAAAAAAQAAAAAAGAVAVAAYNIPYPSRAAFEAATIPAPAVAWSVVQDGRCLNYVRDASGTAITSANGVKGSPAGDVYPEHWGWSATNMTTQVQAAFDWLSVVTTGTKRGGVVHLSSRIYNVGNLQWRSRVNLRGQGRGVSILRALAGTSGIWINIGANVDLFGWSGVAFDGNGTSATLTSAIEFATQTGSTGGAYQPWVADKADNTAGQTKYKHCIAYDFVVGNSAGDGVKINTPSYQVFFDDFAISYCIGHGLNTFGSDSIFSNFYLEQNFKAGLYASGSNNKYANGKSIWSGRGDNTFGNIYVDGDSHMFANVEAQDGFTHGWNIGGSYHRLINVSGNADGKKSFTLQNESTRIHSEFYFRSTCVGIYIDGRAYTYKTAVGDDGFWLAEYPYQFEAFAASQFFHFDIAYSVTTFNSPPSYLINGDRRKDGIDWTQAGGGSLFRDISPASLGSTDALTLRFFRTSSATASDAKVDIMQPGTANVQHSFSQSAASVCQQNGNFLIGQSASGGGWNTGHLRLGPYRLWVDSTGDLRIKNGAPTSDTDGAVVGAQS